MDKQQYLDTITQIGSCEDEVQRRNLLATLHSEAELLFDSNADLTEKNKTLAADNETIRSANMKLFLQVGGKEPEQQHNNQVDEPEKKLRYEDLFDENGGLK